MLLVRAETWMAGARVGSPCNSLLWHWVACMSFYRLRLVGCVAVTFGLAQFAGAASPYTPQRSTHTDTRPVIVAFGDSLSAGFGAEPGKSFPDFLRRDLDSDGLHWRVVN